MNFKLTLAKATGIDNLGFDMANVLSNYLLDEDEAKLVIDGEGDSLIDWLIDQLEAAGVHSDDEQDEDADEEDE